MTVGAIDRFPTLSSVRELDVRRRDHEPGQLNLKSCELLHPAVVEWSRRALATVDPLDVVAYPLVDEARGAVAGLFGRSTDEVLLTPGTDYAIRIVSEGLCAPAGRLVVAATHYESWTRYATHYGFRLDAVTPAPGGAMDLERLAERLVGGPRAVVVVTNPDGCSGQLFGRAELDRLAATVASHGSVLVVDTCYLAFAADGEATVEGLRGAPHVVRIQSFSKSFGLAGARVGAVLADPSVVSYLSRWYPEGIVNGAALTLLVAAIRDVAMFRDVWADVRRQRAALAESLPTTGLGLAPRPSGANFVTFDGDPATTDALYRDLLSSGIRTRLLNGLPGFDGSIRIATPDASAVDRVVAVASRGAPAAAPSPFDLDALRGLRLSDEPYRHGILDRTFSAAVPVGRLCADFPADGFSYDVREDGGGGRKRYRAFNLTVIEGGVVTEAGNALPEPWRGVVRAITSPAYRAAIEECTGASLDGSAIDARLVRYGDQGWIEPHVDRPDKVVTHLVYLNQDWDPARGGALRILRGPRLDDAVGEVFPGPGNSVVMVRSDAAWHGVQPVVGSEGEDRKLLLVHFVRAEREPAS